MIVAYIFYIMYSPGYVWYLSKANEEEIKINVWGKSIQFLQIELQIMTKLGIKSFACTPSASGLILM